jgi:hypothetical protein
MEVSHKIILNKLEEKVKAAKSAENETLLRQHLEAVKTLCELILEERTMEKSMAGPREVSYSPGTVETRPLQPAVQSLSEKKLNVDDANGDSIFDF